MKTIFRVFILVAIYLLSIEFFLSVLDIFDPSANMKTGSYSLILQILSPFHQ